VTRFAQTHKIVVIICSAFGQGNDMMYFLSRGKFVFLVTLLTQRICLYIPVPYAFPCPVVTLAVLGIAPVFVILFVSQFLMLIAVPSIGKPWASRVRTRPLWLSWHLYTSFGQKKSHHRMRSPAMAHVYYIFASISYYTCHGDKQ
jgi:hypothetical protein